MQASIQQDRPSYVMFQVRGVEDRNASIASGAYTERDEVFAIITPSGSKDRIERVASEWFEQLDRDAREGRVPRTWVAEYKAAYDAWKTGQEMPLNGTPILNWPPCSPAVRSALININIRTVEDLAAANDETVTRIGMGARALKQKAIDWMKQANGPGKLIAEMEILRQENAGLKVLVESQNARLAKLETLIGSNPNAAKIEERIPDAKI
jgi:hypothetical protein